MKRIVGALSVVVVAVTMGVEEEVARRRDMRGAGPSRDSLPRQHGKGKPVCPLCQSKGSLTVDASTLQQVFSEILLLGKTTTTTTTKKQKQKNPNYICWLAFSILLSIPSLRERQTNGEKPPALPSICTIQCKTKSVFESSFRTIIFSFCTVSDGQC